VDLRISDNGLDQFIVKCQAGKLHFFFVELKAVKRFRRPHYYNLFTRLLIATTLFELFPATARTWIIATDFNHWRSSNSQCMIARPDPILSG
jgi:hypothetical protein